MGDLLIRLLGLSRGRSPPSFPLSSICCWMDSAQGSSQQLPIKKQEDDDRAPKQEVKPVVKTLNRVPRMAIIFDIHRLLTLFCMLSRCLCTSLCMALLRLPNCAVAECVQKAKNALRGRRQPSMSPMSKYWAGLPF